MHDFDQLKMHSLLNFKNQLFSQNGENKKRCIRSVVTGKRPDKQKRTKDKTVEIKRKAPAPIQDKSYKAIRLHCPKSAGRDGHTQELIYVNRSYPKPYALHLSKKPKQ